MIASRIARRTTAGIAAACIAGAAALAFTAAPASASLHAPAASVVSEPGDYIEVVFRNGNVLKGEIIEETDTSLRMKIDFDGIVAEAIYQKTEILSIKRDIERPDAGATEAEEAKTEEPTRSRSTTSDVNAVRVYFAPLRGYFGRDVTPTPVRDLIEDAARQDADVIIFELNAESQVAFYASLQGGGNPEEQQNFDEFWAAQDIGKIVQTEVKQIFPRDDQPRIIWWVRKAMGGAAFLPFMTSEVYFHPDGLAGGVGNLDVMFGGAGDEVVRDKQRSLRLGTAKGWAINAGYDADIIEAMTMRLQRWAWRLEGGKPVLRKLASNEVPDATIGESMLTDSGIGPEADKLEDIVRGKGNDVLTLNAELARDLDIADGVAATQDELLFELDLARTALRVDEDASRITNRWSSGLVNGERQLRKLVEEYARIQVGGDYRERTRARGQQRRLLEQMRGIQLRYEEAILPQLAGAPDVTTINILIEQIRNQQLADRP